MSSAIDPGIIPPRYRDLFYGPPADPASKPSMRFQLLLAAIFLSVVAVRSPAQEQQVVAQADSDQDGMSDAVEQALLVQFRPTFMVGQQDCSKIPAEFRPDVHEPEPKSENGTIYGQVFPSKTSAGALRTVEIHYYHLWRKDCGAHGHALDTEHVSVLVRASDHHLASGTWKALYWYSAAHENTVCDVSQIARASTLHAEDHGAQVWISPGKHASYLNQTLCQGGCGADKCVNMVALAPGKLINLGEVDQPMNGSLFNSSTAWPLAAKMANTNFPAGPVARLNQLPESDIAWFNAGSHPAHGVIAVSSSTEQAIARSGENTTSAISVAGDSTNTAVSSAGDSTGNALQKSYRNTKHALGTSARHVGDALHVTPKPGAPQ
jgi:hypothetical protein